MTAVRRGEHGLPQQWRPVRVALASHSELVWTGLQAMLTGRAQPFRTTRVVNLGRSAGGNDVVLLDMSAQRAVDTVRNGALAAGDKRVVVWFGRTPNLAAARLGVAGGLAGVMSQQLTAGQLAQSLVDFHRGQRRIFLPPAAHRIPGATRGEAVLSPREAEVVGLIADGLTNEQIARTLFISVNTLKSCIRTAYRKMGVTRRSQAVSWAYEHDLSSLRGPRLAGMATGRPA